MSSRTKQQQFTSSGIRILLQNTYLHQNMQIETRCTKKCNQIAKKFDFEHFLRFRYTFLAYQIYFGRLENKKGVEIPLLKYTFFTFRYSRKPAQCEPYEELRIYFSTKQNTSQPQTRFVYSYYTINRS